MLRKQIFVTSLYLFKGASCQDLVILLCSKTGVFHRRFPGNSFSFLNRKYVSLLLIRTTRQHKKWNKTLAQDNNVYCTKVFLMFHRASLRTTDVITYTPAHICYVCGATRKQVIQIKHLNTHDIVMTADHFLLVQYAVCQATPLPMPVKH
jgi:hypothetical protein